MSRYLIGITEPAEEDLRQIGKYITKEFLSPVTAKEVINKIGNEILRLEIMPLRNAIVPDERLTLLGIRKIIVDNYLVFYIVEESSRIVTVIRILYKRRNWLSLL
ncbi:type II toxin-antitoxin system RelE/ParE family toxin [Desulfuribacillus alkaliarsenatis]|uniref:Plasmid stabilization protein n=1 Tax=Desulfuribacillus alkaliarsenatis TaxID=766136 RepID=A0A1E5G182_9FIRM|nr:type II toxin-antitoxin system RelE/ParE family toxin [Desulfuribacillus alkaliarsenatis]OEF96668.1 plasmid stabilization protein [Desulfuribacillus alkaliarsenatis]